MKNLSEKFGLAGVIALVITFICTPLAAWFTHVVTCIGAEKWLFLIAGAVMAPIGVIHGIGIWIGVW